MIIQSNPDFMFPIQNIDEYVSGLEFEMSISNTASVSNIKLTKYYFLLLKMYLKSLLFWKKFIDSNNQLNR